MLTIGLIGGMSWESTALYYQKINQLVREARGGLHSAQLILYSVDFAQIEPLQRAGDWTGAANLLSQAAQSLERAGADFLVLCTNTMHKVAAPIQAAVQIPLLHIADPTAVAIVAAGHSCVGLLGTRFTMEQDFYKQGLARHGLQVLVQPSAAQAVVHRVIYEELCVGRITAASRHAYQAVMEDLVARGAQAIVLGCTEITLLIGQNDASVPLFDTTGLHAQAAAQRAMATQL